MKYHSKRTGTRKASISVYLPLAWVRQIAGSARRAKMSVSELVALWIKQGWAQWEKDAEEQNGDANGLR